MSLIDRLVKPARTEEGRQAAFNRMFDNRRRTVIEAVVASAIVASFFGYMNDRDQRGRSLTNCKLVQRDRLDRARELERSSDTILGNPHHKPPIARFKLKGTAFEAFAPLIIAQARQDRRNAQAIRGRVENCDKVFPQPNPLPFL